MKKTIYQFLIGICLLASGGVYPALGHAATPSKGSIIVGQVHEITRNRMIVQVGNTSFTLGEVYQDEGDGEVKVDRFALRSKLWVEVYVGYAGGHYPKAEKMVILLGQRLADALGAMEGASER